MRIIHKAPPADYPPYTEMYMRLLPDDGNILYHLKANFYKVKSFITHLPEEKLYYRYAPDKWSIKEILVHIIDDERIFSYRALCFGRNEKKHLIGFDQNSYARESDAGNRSLEGIFDEYEAVRQATISLFTYLPEDALDRKGKGTGSCNNATPRALVYHIAGHEQRHINIIKERYLHLATTKKE